MRTTKRGSGLGRPTQWVLSCPPTTLAGPHRRCQPHKPVPVPEDLAQGTLGMW